MTGPTTAKFYVLWGPLNQAMILIHARRAEG